MVSSCVLAHSRLWYTEKMEKKTDNKSRTMEVACGGYDKVVCLFVMRLVKPVCYTSSTAFFPDNVYT